MFTRILHAFYIYASIADAWLKSAPPSAMVPYRHRSPQSGFVPFYGKLLPKCQLWRHRLLVPEYTDAPTGVEYADFRFAGDEYAVPPTFIVPISP